MQNVLQVSSGSVLSTHNGATVLRDAFSYPLAINFSASPDGSNSECSPVLISPFASSRPAPAPPPQSPRRSTTRTSARCSPARSSSAPPSTSASSPVSTHPAPRSPYCLTTRPARSAGGAFHLASTGNSGSNGTSNNTFTYADAARNTFDRQVNAFVNNITFDHQSGSLAPASTTTKARAPASVPLAQAAMKARLPGGRTVGN